jgi:hypothetical protein
LMVYGLWFRFLVQSVWFSGSWTLWPSTEHVLVFFPRVLFRSLEPNGCWTARMFLIRSMEINGLLDRVKGQMRSSMLTVTIVTQVTVVNYCEVSSEFPPWIPSLVA